MGLKLPLLEFSAEQEVSPQTRSISARNSMKSPGLDFGAFTATTPSGPTSTFMNTLNVVPICSGRMPNLPRAV
ncbi:hypothetical protein D3C71_2179030 [compost metagenome]